MDLGDNFIGNIEARYILEGKADVVICDGFTGNIVLKLIEGTVNKMLSWATDSINNHSISSHKLKEICTIFL